MKKRFLVFFVAIMFIVPLAIYAGAPAGAIKVKKSGSKKAAVSFTHSKHKGCGAKAACHKAAKSKSSAHKFCKGCHKKQGGPKSCKACHK